MRVKSSPQWRSNWWKVRVSACDHLRELLLAACMARQLFFFSWGVSLGTCWMSVVSVHGATKDSDSVNILWLVESSLSSFFSRYLTIVASTIEIILKNKLIALLPKQQPNSTDQSAGRRQVGLDEGEELAVVVGVGAGHQSLELLPLSLGGPVAVGVQPVHHLPPLLAVGVHPPHLVHHVVHVVPSVFLVGVQLLPLSLFPLLPHVLLPVLCLPVHPLLRRLPELGLPVALVAQRFVPDRPERQALEVLLGGVPLPVAGRVDEHMLISVRLDLGGIGKGVVAEELPHVRHRHLLLNGVDANGLDLGQQFVVEGNQSPHPAGTAVEVTAVFPDDAAQKQQLGLLVENLVLLEIVLDVLNGQQFLQVHISPRTGGHQLPQGRVNVQVFVAEEEADEFAECLLLVEAPLDYQVVSFLRLPMLLHYKYLLHQYG